MLCKIYRIKNRHPWIKFLAKPKKPFSGGTFGLSLQNQTFSEKFGSVNF